MEHTTSLTHFAIILAAAFIGGVVFQRLRQPMLVGYILVGVLFGPHVLGLVHGQESISLMAEVGILLLLFLAGMEIHLERFMSIARISLITCALQIAIGLAAMFLFGFFLDWPLSRSVLLGFALSLSSTAVALKIVEDMGLKATRQGETCTGILVAQDIAVIPMLLIIGAMNTHEGFNYIGIARLFIAVALIVVIMFVLLKRPRLLDWLWSKVRHIREDAVQRQGALMAMAFCFSAAALSGLLGLSAAYGAFLAGLALGQTRHSKRLEEQTKPIFEVMIMVFFLSIGLLIDLSFLKEHIISVLALVFFAMCMKTVANYLILHMQGMERQEAGRIGAVLAQIGEFSFVLAAMGLEVKTIDLDSYKYVVAVISLSLMATPLWLFSLQKMRLFQRVDVAILQGRRWWRRRNQLQ